MGHVVHHVLVDLHVVGTAHQGVELHAQLILRRRHFVVMLFGFDAHLGHQGQHFGPQVGERIDRRHREIAALDGGPMADVAAFEVAAGVVGALLLVDGIEGVVHRDVVAHVVEDEELGLGPEEGFVAGAGVFQVLLGPAGGGTGIAAVGLAGRGLHHVTEHDQRILRRKGVHHGAFRVGHERHVGFADVLPAGNRGAVEHDAVAEGFFLDHGAGHGQMLPFAARVGEAQIDETDVFVLEAFEYGVNVGHGDSPFPKKNN